MSISKNENEYEEIIFGMSSTDSQPANQRHAVRYIRTDITAAITASIFLGFAKDIPVKLLDISSKGATIECDKKLVPKKKIVLKLFFKDNKKFTITAQVVHQKGHDKKQYGLKFSSFNNELGDHLLSSQTDLIFK